jgi:hypothetical protein
MNVAVALTLTCPPSAKGLGIAHAQTINATIAETILHKVGQHSRFEISHLSLFYYNLLHNTKTQ